MEGRWLGPGTAAHRVAVTKEKQLLEALDRYGVEADLTIDMGPSAELTFPLADGSTCRIPLALLMDAPDVCSKPTVTRRRPKDLDQPVWAHPASWDRKDD